MKQFLLFVGFIYYPVGGWNDFHSSYDDYEDAIGVGVRKSQEEGWGLWFHVVDRVSGDIVHAEVNRE